MHVSMSFKILSENKRTSHFLGTMMLNDKDYIDPSLHKQKFPLISFKISNLWETVSVMRQKNTPMTNSELCAVEGSLLS